jgi:hypothetical protein
MESHPVLWSAIAFPKLLKSPQPWERIWGPKSGHTPELTGSINCPNVDDGYSVIIAYFQKKSKRTNLKLQLSGNISVLSFQVCFGIEYGFNDPWQQV